MRRIDAILGLLTTSGLALACKPTLEASEVPATSAARAGEASCRHELGRCGGHLPGDGSCGAATSGEDHVSPPAGTLTDVRLQPGEFAEINLEMAAGATTTAEFAATGGALAWNVHSHEGERVVIHDEGTRAAGRVRFTAARAGAYSYLWNNAGSSAVTLRVTLQSTGAVKVQSVHRPAP